jgi:hypothetical protein
MYSLAADFVGGATGLQIPIKINKAAPGAALQQQLAFMTDVSHSADEELLYMSTLILVWAHITNLGASKSASPPPCADTPNSAPPPPPPSADRDQVKRDVSLLEPMVTQVRPLLFTACTAVGLCVSCPTRRQVFRNPIACMCGAAGLPANHPCSKGKGNIWHLTQSPSILHDSCTVTCV